MTITNLARSLGIGTESIELRLCCLITFRAIKFYHGVTQFFCSRPQHHRGGTCQEVSQFRS